MLPKHDELYLGTGEVARLPGVMTQTVLNWMTRGVTIRGMPVRLQYIRVGTFHRTTREWLHEFMDRCNADAPPPIETQRQRSKRVEHDMDAMYKELAKNTKPEPGWTAEMDEWVRTLPPAKVAELTGRKIGSVYKRRWYPGVDPGREIPKPKR